MAAKGIVLSRTASSELIEQAKAAGDKTYFTGKPCRKGHIALRFVSTRSCVVCQGLHWKAQKAAAPEVFAEYAARRDPQRARESSLRHYYKNIEDITEARRSDSFKSHHRDWQTTKYQEDPVFRVSRVLRQRLRAAVKDSPKRGSFVKDLGCSVEFLRGYLEAQFYGDMTWANYGEAWEIDHRQPLASFDLTDRNDFLSAAHYSNLQPLTRLDHKKKTATDRHSLIVIKGSGP